MNSATHIMWYTVWDKKTGELLCSGPARNCAKALGYSTTNTFLSSIWHCNAQGGMKKYDVLREIVEKKAVEEGR